MALPEFFIHSTKFSKLLEFCNKLTGSEKNRKVLHFFYNNGLKMYASDGCLEATFKLNQEVEDFLGTYALSIKTLKLFIEEADDQQIEFTLNKEGIRVRQNTEILSVNNTPSKTIPQQSLFGILGDFQTNEFLAGLDFSTVHMPENEDCYLFVFDGILYVLTVYDKVFSLYNTQKMCKNLEVAVPYQSVRHLIKALRLLKTEQFRLGESVSQDRIGFQTTGNLTSICSRSLETKEGERLLKLINLYDRFEPVHQINREILKKSVTKAERISPSLPIKMTLESDRITFELKSSSFYYSCVDEIDPCDHVCHDQTQRDAQYRLMFYGKYLKSALSRMTTNEITIYKYENFMAFGDSTKNKLICLTDVV